MVCASVLEDNIRDLVIGVSPVHTDTTPYISLLIAPVCINTFCIARYVMSSIGISIKEAIVLHILFFLSSYINKKEIKQLDLTN